MTTEFTLTEGDMRLGGRELILMGGEHNGYPVAIKFPNGTVREFCKRCGGTGQYSFNLFDGTMCYGCSGRALGENTTEADIIRKAENREKARARREAKAKKDAEKAAVIMAEWKAANAALLDALLPYLAAEGEWFEGFLADLADKAHRGFKPLTERQVEAALRAAEQDRERQAVKAAVVSAKTAVGHFGTVDAKVTAEVTVQAVKGFEGQYGTRFLVTMETTEGHTLKTWTTGNFVSDALDAKESGEVITIKATVKAHGDYNDIPETTLLRVSKV